MKGRPLCRGRATGQWDDDDQAFAQLRILGSLSGRAKAYWKALDFVSAHRENFPFERMISNRYALADVNIGLERTKNYEEIKPVIQP